MHAFSEEHKGFLDIAFNALHLLADNVEADGLGEGTALAHSHDIADFEAESGGAVSRHSLMALLKSVVLLDVVQVVATDDNCAGHLVRDNNTPILIINTY